ncbi:uncharacterized protein LOC106355863 [Brassica napus]|uniref:uncharacterized protein LOC106355863 n=1 Tax=Brassica napus TaxID=3708 RepID=UPI0006AB1AA0|nr:uncharacterized protein LOC106355863 [Brassica napus]
MPKIWRVYDRVRGIALSSEKFQFVFKREDDMETVLKDRPWSFNHWTMLIDRWVPSPPKTFLSTVDVWVRIHHIPMNYYTLDTMDFLARKIGKVIEIAYDPNVSQKDTFILAQVRLDIANPTTATHVLNIPSGGQVMIEFEYEKLRKRPDCPMLHIKSPRAAASVNSSKEKVVNTVIARGQQELGVYLSVPPGFEPLFPELPPEERAMAMQYIAHSDPTERQARIVRVQQSILTEGVPEWVDMPKISHDLFKDNSLVFGFELQSGLQSGMPQKGDPRSGTGSLPLSFRSQRRCAPVENEVSSSSSSCDPLVFRIGSSLEGRSSGTKSSGNKNGTRPQRWKRLAGKKAGDSVVQRPSGVVIREESH